MNLSNQQIETINTYMTGNFEPHIIYLFGSSVGCNFNDESDIDIAFLTDKEASEYEIFIHAQNLADSLGREVDLVDLNKASTVFKTQVIGNGRVIHCTNQNRKEVFEMMSLKEYALLNEERSVVLDEIKRRHNIYGE